MLPKLLLIPLIAGFIAQMAKYIWHAAHAGSFELRSISFYGGMPSAHTATVAALLTVIGLHEGAASPAFAVAAVFGILVIRDAIGFRRYIGGHGRALNRIIRTLPETEQRGHETLQEHLGHTPVEAFVGAVLGFSISAVFYLIIP